MQEWMLGALLVLTVSWLITRIRQNSKAEKAESRPARVQQGAFSAVSIKYSENACDAAKAMTGRRFLANAPPQLPLPECDFPKCRCQFIQHKDRRSKNDRRSPFRPAGPSGMTGSFEKERRQRADRRKSAKGPD